MENDLISVIVPVYNVKKYLEACVQSILAQSYGNFELILVDDGSKDGSASICDDLAGRDNRIIVIHLENGGASSARNHGLQVMRGTYCTFVDSDDIVEADWLKHLHEKISTTDTQLACCSYYIVHPDGRKETAPCQYDGEANKNDALFLCLQPHGYRGLLWNKIFRSDIIKEHSLQMNVSLPMMEDTDFVCLYMQYVDNVCFSATPPLYNYATREDSAIHTLPIITMVRACQCILPTIQKSFDVRCENLMRWMYYTSLILHLQRTFDDCSPLERKALLKDIKRERNYFLLHYKYSWLGYAKKIVLEMALRLRKSKKL